jgi:hypothetical protein
MEIATFAEMWRNQHSYPLPDLKSQFTSLNTSRIEDYGKQRLKAQKTLEETTEDSFANRYSKNWKSKSITICERADKLKQDRQCTYNVTLRRVRETFISVKKQ